MNSGFVYFAAMSNHMNRNMALLQIACVQDTPVTNPQLVQMRESASQSLRFDLIVVFRKPLDLFYNPSGNRSVELREILKRLRRELDLIIQASFNLSFTSWSVMRSEESRDSSSLALISSVISRHLSGSVMMFCSSSCTTFLINACNSSTVRSAVFIGLPSSIMGLTV